VDPQRELLQQINKQITSVSVNSLHVAYLFQSNLGNKTVCQKHFFSIIEPYNAQEIRRTHMDFFILN
jgi:hypothetical protein